MFGSVLMTRRRLFAMVCGVVVAAVTGRRKFWILGPTPGGEKHQLQQLDWSIDDLREHESRAVVDAMESAFTLSERAVKRLNEGALWTHVEFDRS